MKSAIRMIISAAALAAAAAGESCIKKADIPLAVRAHTQEAASSAGDIPIPAEKKDTPQEQRHNHLRIFDIQGISHRSPFDGNYVSGIKGIVTGITYSKKKPTGFYLQDSVGDENPATSDGIYVFCGKNMPQKLAVGDEAVVAGTVSEYTVTDRYGSVFLSITQLVPEKTADVQILSHNNALPKAICITAKALEKPVFLHNLEILEPAQEAIDYYESLECMRVQVLNPKVAAAPHNGTYYIAPGDASGFSIRGGILYNSYNSTARLCMDPKHCFSTAAEAGIKGTAPAAGDAYSGTITGILSYGQGNYYIAPVETLPPLISRGLSPEKTGLPFDKNMLNIACYNLENFSAHTVKDKNGKVINHSSGKTSVQRAAAFAEHFINKLNAPDIICLIEIQDDDSTEKSELVSAKKTFQLLLDNIHTIAPHIPYTVCSIDPKKNADGGASGANIRCGFLYRTDRIALVPDSDNTLLNSTHSTAAEFISAGKKLRQNPARLGIGEDCFNRTRKPLVGHFTFKQGVNGGKDFIVINNHFSSKQADSKIWGGIQPVDRKSEVRRHKQAETVRRFIAGIRKMRPELPVIAVGDYNDFWFSKTIGIIKEAGMNNAIELLPENDRYTYLYDGHSQTLDNILVTDNAVITAADIVHINAEFSPKERLSDHDPVVIHVKIPE